VILVFNRFISYVLAPKSAINENLRVTLVFSSLFVAAGLIVASIEPLHTLVPELTVEHLVRILLVFTLFTFYLIMVNFFFEGILVLLSSKFRHWRKSRNLNEPKS
jgi:hypothetical protein